MNKTKIYKEQPISLKYLQTNPFVWIKTLKPSKEFGTNKDTNELTRNRLIRIKPTQIKMEVEDLEQENRQIKTALAFVAEINENLKTELQNEQQQIQLLWIHYNKRSKSAIVTTHHDEEMTSKKGHLTKNLNFQIYLTETETKKTEKDFRQLQKTDDYYQYI